MGFRNADEYMKVTITKVVPISEKHDAIRSIVSRDLSWLVVKECAMMQCVTTLRVKRREIFHGAEGLISASIWSRGHGHGHGHGYIMGMIVKAAKGTGNDINIMRNKTGTIIEYEQGESLSIITSYWYWNKLQEDQKDLTGYEAA